MKCLSLWIAMLGLLALPAFCQNFDQDLATLSAAPNRLSGTVENEAAANYLEKRLREIGVDEVLVQEFPSVQLVTKRCDVLVSGQTLKLYPVRPNGIVPPVTPAAGITGPLLYAGNGALADYRDRSPQGAIVVLDYDSGENWPQAFRLGASAVIFLASGKVSSGDAHFVDANVNLPRFFFAGDSASLPEGATATIQSEVTWEPTLVKNVFGLVRGTNPEFFLGRPEMVVVSTQIDTYGEVPELTPGGRGAANMAGLLQMAAQVKTAPPRRHVLFAFLNNEARGYEGSRQFYRAMDNGIREISATLKVRAESLEAEKAYLQGMDLALSDSNPLGAAGDLSNELFNRLRLAADEQIELSRTSLANMRRAKEGLIASQDALDKSSPEWQTLAGQIDAMTSELASRQKPHEDWTTFRRALASAQLMSIEENARYAQTVAIVKGEVASRLAEIAMEERALRSDERLNELLGQFQIVLQLSVRFGDTTDHWGFIFGKDSRLGNTGDAPGLYGRVYQTLKSAADSAQPALEKFESTAVNPNRQLNGAEFLTHSGEIAGRYGVFNAVAGTALDNYPREGTPLDTVAVLDKERVAGQMEEFGRLLLKAADREELSSNAPIVRQVRYVHPRFSDNRVSGALALRRTAGSSIANRPAEGAILQITPSHPAYRTRGAHPETHYERRKPVAFDNFIVARASANGAMSYGPVNIGAESEFGVGMLFDDRGAVTAVSDLPNGMKTASRVNLFPARGAALVAPPQMIPGYAKVLDGRTNSMLDSARSLSATQDGLVFWYTEEKVPDVKVFGTSSAVAMNFEAEKEEDQATHYGAGLPMGKDWKFPRLSSMASQDLLALNGDRLSKLRARGVSDASVEELNARAEDLKAGQDTAASVAEAESLGFTSFFNSQPVYESVRRNLDDLVFSVLVLLALAVPFAFALERLLIGATSIYQQIAYFVSFFIATFLLLYFTHPAFAVSNAPMIIFLGFTIVTLSSMVIFIIMQKFEVELKLLQGMATTVHSADVSRFSTIMAAMNMGISTMRRRPVRTALTAVTIILLTFTILCFASFGGALGVAKRFIAPLPDYSGVLIHRVNWGALDPGLLDVLSGRVQAQDVLTGRYWISPKPETGARTALAREDGSHPVAITGVLGLTREEIEMRPDLKAVFGAPTESFEDSIWMTNVVMETLGVKPGERVRLNGRSLLVANPVDADRLSTLRDMDASSILPVDFDTMQSLMGVQPDAVVDEAEVGGQSWETLPVSSLVVVSASMARSLFASLRAITIYTQDNADAGRLGDEAARMLRSPVAATRDDGVYWHLFGNVIATSGVKDLLLPILLGGLVVFGTMLGSVADREKEIYTFSALGLAPPHVASLFFAEALVFSVIGGLGGYLTAQAVLEGLKWLASMDMATVPTINYSSTNAIITILIVMCTVMASAIYPAIKASRSANPGVLRSWKMPEPQGDECRIVFPFTVSVYDVTGVVSFLREHFENFQDTSLGVFLAKNTRLLIEPDSSLGVASEIALAPFDLGVTQEFELRSAPSEIEGIDEVVILLRRLSGQPKDWKRLNKVLLDDLRKQFLIWRSLPAEVMENYRMRTLQEIQAKQETAEKSPA